MLGGEGHSGRTGIPVDTNPPRPAPPGVSDFLGWGGLARG